MLCSNYIYSERSRTMARRRRKNKLSNVKIKRIRRKKATRRLVWQIAILGAGVAAGILVRPSIIPDPKQRAQVEGVREQILEANEVAQEKAYEVLGESTDVVGNVVSKVSEATEEISGTNPQQVVEEKVTSFAEEIKSLPEKQVKKIKLEFCAELIEEIELSCEEN